MVIHFYQLTPNILPVPQPTHYATVTEALSKLHQQGFTTDFNIKGDCLIAGEDKFNANEFDIVDTYRYEGNSDPGDEAIVYAIQSKSGVKGTLVTGYGASAEDVSPELMEKLTVK